MRNGGCTSRSHVGVLPPLRQWVPIAVVPPLNPDVTIVHAQRADRLPQRRLCRRRGRDLVMLGPPLNVLTHTPVCGILTPHQKNKLRLAVQ